MILFLQMLGFTDLDPEDFVYFKTGGGHWVAASGQGWSIFFFPHSTADNPSSLSHSQRTSPGACF